MQNEMSNDGRNSPRHFRELPLWKRPQELLSRGIIISHPYSTLEGCDQILEIKRYFTPDFCVNTLDYKRFIVS